ncbi:MAG: DUF1924 domain-containing protein [Magnetococcales bacterium]|nr:DUF1924 domain-containing protein [Magnetococcales bacterium]
MAAPLDEQLATYRAQGAGAFEAKAGEKLWRSSLGKDAEGNDRSCVTCHTGDPKQAGKHPKTGKAIEPMAQSVNVQRFTDPAKVEKWFGRNCRQVLGRECTPQEKGNILTYLGSQ